MKYKINDILRVKSGCEKECGTFGRAGGKFIKITRVESNCYSYDILDKDFKEIGTCSNCFKDEHLEPREKTWETLQEGDVVIDYDNEEREVLGVCGKVYHLGSSVVKDYYGFSRTIQEMKNGGFKLKDTKPIIEELTVEEIYKELGREVKIIRG